MTNSTQTDIRPTRELADAALDHVTGGGNSITYVQAVVAHSATDKADLANRPD